MNGIYEILASRRFFSLQNDFNTKLEISGKMFERNFIHSVVTAFMNVVRADDSVGSSSTSMSVSSCNAVNTGNHSIFKPWIIKF